MHLTLRLSYVTGSVEGHRTVGCVRADQLVTRILNRVVIKFVYVSIMELIETLSKLQIYVICISNIILSVYTNVASIKVFVVGWVKD